MRRLLRYGFLLGGLVVFVANVILTWQGTLAALQATWHLPDWTVNLIPSSLIFALLAGAEIQHRAERTLATDQHRDQLHAQARRLSEQVNRSQPAALGGSVVETAFRNHFPREAVLLDEWDAALERRRRAWALLSIRIDEEGSSLGYPTSQGTALRDLMVNVGAGTWPAARIAWSVRKQPGSDRAAIVAAIDTSETVCLCDDAIADARKSQLSACVEDIAHWKEVTERDAAHQAVTVLQSRTLRRLDRVAASTEIKRVSKCELCAPY